MVTALQANDSDLKNELAKLVGSDAWDAARLAASAQAKVHTATQPARALYLQLAAPAG